MKGRERVMRLAAYQFAVCGDIDHNLEIIKKAIVSASTTLIQNTITEHTWFHLTKPNAGTTNGHSMGGMRIILHPAMKMEYMK